MTTNSGQICRSANYWAQTGTLLGAVAQVSSSLELLEDRRMAVLNCLAEQTGADSGCWTWGCGNPTTQNVMPLAMVPFGMTEAQRGLLLVWGTSTEMQQTYQRLIYSRFDARRQVTTLSQDLPRYAAEASMPERQFKPDWADSLANCGWRAFLHCVRQGSENSWSALILLRKLDRPDFSFEDGLLADLAMERIGWLQSNTEEIAGRETFYDLTPRQRTVMLLLLDGQPRKVIASRLGLSEDTIGDHIKAVYSAFGVNSALELVAKFLRSK